MDEYIELAKRQAESAKFRYRVGCIILDRKNNIISSARNSTKTHPLQFKYATKHGQAHRIFLHAEIAALIKCRIDPYTAVIVRLGRSGSMRPSHPCPLCMDALKEAGVKEIFYLGEDGNFCRKYLSKETT
jgi:tRNA(Arg) A34 adenosine deaminase TadA